MERLARQVRLALQVPEPVLLVGERGAGKQTVARVIHHQGRDAESAFAGLDCERLPADALAALLAGAPPALAGVGTVYLRQVCGLPRELQALLCQRLASGGDRPRVIAGLTAPAEELVHEGRLLRELAGLLSPLTLDVPPLRQRLDDLPHLIERMLPRLQGGPVALSPAAHEVLRGHAWPGNLAELFAVLADSRPRATQARIDAGDLPASLRLGDRLGREAPRPPAQAPLPELLEQVERRLIEVALRRARGNRSKAADALGIYRSLLVRRMKALGLEAQEE
jgi:DNA-binding NtrC family response regulator